MLRQIQFYIIGPRGDPKYYGYTWTNWLDYYEETPASIPGKLKKLPRNFNDEHILDLIRGHSEILKI